MSKFSKDYTRLLLDEFFSEEDQTVIHTGHALTLNRQRICEDEGDKIWTDGAFLCEKNGRFVSNPEHLNGYYEICGASYCIVKRHNEKPVLHYAGKIEELNLECISHLDLA